jgi:hypothetical protein
MFVEGCEERMRQSRAIKSVALSGSILTLALGCAPPNADIVGRVDIPQAPNTITQPELPPDVRVTEQSETRPTAPAPQLRWITLDGGAQKWELNPKVDLLFVIDDSDSMREEQDNLSRNINRFVEGFGRNRMIDFQIGVTSVWDSTPRYLSTNKSGYSVGELRKIPGAQPGQPERRFLTRSQGFESILARALKIGVTPMAQGGPEVEEVFSPISEAIKKSAPGAPNAGFMRSEAQLVVITVTDAEDGSASLTPEQLASQLVDAKGGRKELLSAYGVLVKSSDPDSVKDWGLRIHPRYQPQCFRTDAQGRPSTTQNGRCTTGFGPERIERFILLANSDAGSPAEIRSKHIMSLNQADFGRDLARIGSDISAKALKTDIHLDQVPRVENGRILMRVRYGSPEALAKGQGQVIPMQARGGWLYDPEAKAIRLSGDISYQYQPGARFAVDMVPLTPN